MSRPPLLPLAGVLYAALASGFLSTSTLGPQDGQHAAASKLMFYRSQASASGIPLRSSEFEALANVGGFPCATSERGPVDAPVAIIEFSDFECPSCGGAESAVRDVLTKYPSQVRFIFKHFPLPIHSHAEPAHEAALAAGAQGRFWEMRDLLFSNQTRLERYDLHQYAQRLNLDVHVYTLALSTHAYPPTVEENLAEARALGVSATPTFFVNGTRLLGLQTRDALEGAVRQALSFGTNRSPKLLGQAKDPDVH